MVRFKNPPDGSHPGADAMTYPPGSRFNDMSSYVTDTSSITNPVELRFSYSDEDESSATSALTGLTGWTSANGGGGGGLAAVSELSNESEENFPVAHSKSNKSGDGTEAVSDMAESNAISALSFDMDGSVEASLGEVDDGAMPRSRSNKSKGGGKRPMEAINPAKAVQFRTRSGATVDSPRPGHKSKGNAFGGVVTPPTSPTSSVRSNNSGESKNSNASKKRAPVPPLPDPKMDDSEEDQMWEEDCNYDINPTLMYLVLESRDWKEAVALLDGKGLENKNDAWNLGQLFGGKRRAEANAAEHTQLTEKRKNELRAQARTWIVRRERNGMLRWRMLPLHASLAFNAPFDVVLRLYHLYPGAVRCRNDQGMLPMHHCFKYGTEDKVLELLLDVFPEANTVLDDQGRLPLACTPKDGSDNERRSNILTLFSNFQVELALRTMKAEVVADAPAAASNGVPQRNALPARDVAAAAAHQRGKAQSRIELLSPTPTSPTGTLGAAPRYTTSMDYSPVTFNAIKPPTVAATSDPSKKRAEVEQAPVQVPLTPTSPKEDSIADRYATFSCEDSENNSSIGNGRLGLSTIPEEGDGAGMTPPKKDQTALKLELLALGEKKKRKGLRKLFGKKRATLTQA